MKGLSTKVIAAFSVISLVAAFGCGWKVRGWYEDSQKKRAVETLAKDAEEAQQQAELEAQALNKQAAKQREVIEDEHAEIESNIRKANGLGCLTDRAAELHHDIIKAVSGGDPARVGCDKQ